ncbi:elongation factor P 5-aminopentanone reductase [Evansella sp. AB-rgal1]|uniref:elongation factor P 5-aminopentanone reductase n=1 Tax=Evansella sp. AB-rgal1 TaxID=3242696 RepID=UPI00359E3C8C
MKERPVALITGASGGIGNAIAKMFAKKGYSLVLHFNKNKENIYQLLEEIKTYDVHCEVVQADFAHSLEAVEKIKAAASSVDVIVHNCGSSNIHLMTEVSFEQVQSELAIGITTPFLITQAYLPEMISKKVGKIIVISSIWGLTGASCEVLYSTIKGGMNTFVKALAKEVAPSNIQVNGVAPGAIETPMLHTISQHDLEILTQDIPAGRLGSANDVASTVGFLASDESNYINGQIISVNGGWYC